MKFSMKHLFIIEILTTFAIMLWLLLTPSLSSEIVFLSYSKNRLLMNTVAITVFMLLLICLGTLRFQKAQGFFKKVFSSKTFVSFFIFVIVVILQSLFFYLVGSFGEKSVYYEKMGPLLLLFFLLSVEVLVYLHISTEGNVFRLLYSAITNLKTKEILLIIGFLLGIYLIIVFFSLSKGHNWGDDFAQYLLQSNSLLTGTVNSYIQGTLFTNQNSPFSHSPTTVPWGFPIVLLPFINIFNQNILGLKFVNVLAYSAFLIILYKWSSLRLSKLASILVLLFFAISPTFIQFHNQVITDLFFLLCSMMSLLLLDVYNSRPDKKLLFGILLGFSIFYASFTRTNGYFLLAALAFSQIVPLIQKIVNKKKLDFTQVFVHIIPYLIFALCYLIQDVLLPNFKETAQSVIDRVSIDIILTNIHYYFWQLSGIFSDLLFSKIIYIITLPLVVLGVIVSRKSLSSWSVIIYATITLGLYVCYPGLQGIRYLFPIIPIYIVYIAHGISKIAAFLRAKKAGFVSICLAFIFSLMVTQYVIADINYAIRNITADRIELEGPYSPNSIEMFDYIQNNTNSDSVIVFFRPRAMRYISGRNSVFANTCEGLSNGNYLVRMKAEEFRSNGLQINLTELEKCINSQKLDMKLENDEIAIYEILEY